MNTFLSISIIICSILLIASILIQKMGAGLSGVLGGAGGNYHTRRGFEKILFQSTFFFATVLAVCCILFMVM
jgi:protein translocase SecG subunit